jgi:hypothetical protein
VKTKSGRLNKQGKQVFQLPNGRTTTSSKEMTQAWKDVYSILEYELNLHCIGFNPDFLFEDCHTHQTVTIPLWLAYKIIDMGIKYKEQADETQDYLDVIVSQSHKGREE